MSKLNCLSVNDLFKENISTLTAADMPRGKLFDKESRLKYLGLEKAINTMGEKSSKAQGLRRILTTFEKLYASPDQKLYLLKDENGNGGAGELIGILKIGPKQLYLHDTQDKLVISSPMCVLDFYVVESRQRIGFGKKLFDYMLEDQKMKAHNLAIDGPSPKMLQFLKKHYNFTKVLSYANNFSVSEKFFESAKTGPAKLPERNKYTPHSNIRRTDCEAGAVIHGDRSTAGTHFKKSLTMSVTNETNRRPTLKKWSSEAGAVIHGGSSSSRTMSSNRFH